jgi:hypothetical protein
VTFGAYPEHQVDEFNRQHKLELEEKKANLSKLPDKPFKSMVFGLKSFNSDKDILHEDAKSPLV